MMKLLKYEIKQTWKMCTTLAGITLLACMAMIFSPFKTYSVMFPLYIILCVLVVVVSSVFLFFYCMGSFNQEFTRPQGYLIMTLPIKARDFIWAKFINQGIWGLLTALIMSGTARVLFKEQLSQELMEQGMGLTIIGRSMLNSIASYILAVFVIYFSIAILSKQPSDNHNNFVKIIISIILSYSIGIIIGLVSIFIPYSFKNGIPGNLEDIERLSYYVQENIGRINATKIIITLMVAAIFYFATESLIDNKVQL